MFNQALATFQDYLVRFEQQINDLNVFPVPDSDTGTNCLVTVRGGLDQITQQVHEAGNLSATQLATAFAQGSSNCALGNSGVIFSAYASGLAGNLTEPVDLQVWQQALTRAAKAASQAVLTPAQGTMLTVANAVTETNCTDLISQLITNSVNARITLVKTTEMLPELQIAGVVDAGAFVLTLFHDAFAKLVADENFQELELTTPDCEMLPSKELFEYDGPVHELMFNVFLLAHSKNELISSLPNFGESIAVSPVTADHDQEKIRIHIHTNDPDDVIKLAKEYGLVSDLVLINLKLHKT